MLMRVNMDNFNPHDIDVKGAKEALAKLKKEANEVAGWWNGDESGTNEDRAHICTDMEEHIDKLNELLDEYLEV